MGRSTFFSLGLLAVFLSLSGTEGYRCPVGWHSRNGLCYKAFPQLKTWLDAEMSCREYKPGCHLASLHSNEDSAVLAWFIADYFTGQGHIWIGLRDTNKKRNWEWSDKSFTNYFAWNSGEPNNLHNKEYCVHLWGPSAHRKWNDTPCDFMYPYLCQCKF